MFSKLFIGFCSISVIWRHIYSQYFCPYIFLYPLYAEMEAANMTLLWALEVLTHPRAYRGYKNIYGQKYWEYMGRQITEILEKLLKN